MIVFQDGSIRVIRNGIGIEELATVELPGIKALFTLRVDSVEFDDYIILVIDGQTHALMFTGDELEDTGLSGIFLLFDVAWLKINCGSRLSDD